MSEWAFRHLYALCAVNGLLGVWLGWLAPTDGVATICARVIYFATTLALILNAPPAYTAETPATES